MSLSYGVIDLGTNTFHLLIIEKKSNGKFREIFRKRVFVKLASEGIDTIGAAPFQRGIETLLDFSKTLKKHSVKNIRAIGTAAVFPSEWPFYLSLSIKMILFQRPRFNRSTPI